ncbi:MAG: Hsp70 family protein [Prochlorotrichaceae cyanobacterium]|jgi:molecular chaperone DnaK (HSP70)
MTIAIDFGTSNTVVARWNTVTEKAETLSLPGLSTLLAQNPPLIPSLVYVESAETPQVLAGQTVRDRGLDVRQDPRFFQSFKRGIGAAVPGFQPELDGKLISFEQVGAWFLETVIAGIQAVPLPLDSLVLTVPVDSFEPYRHWLGTVFEQIPDLQQVRLLDEPTAAALGYGMDNQDLLLVVDFGGGTLDLSLVKLETQAAQRGPLGFILQWGDKSFAERSGQRSQIARVLAKSGKNLGGTDIDQWVAQALVQTYGLTDGLNPLILRLAERLKIQLSLSSQATEVYFDDRNFESYEFQLDREQLNTILKEQRFFESCDQALQQVLQQARRQGIEKKDIQGVLLVGGTSQIPAIQDWIQGYFATDQIRAQKPFEAIAHGALRVAQGIEVKDFLYHSYGIRYWNHRSQSQDWHPLIRAGQPYPLREPVELVLGASVEKQPSIELVLGELGDEGSNTEVYFDGDRLITRTLQSQQRSVVPLNDSDRGRTLAPLNPPGSPGVDRVRVSFTVDENRQLRATVEDLLTLETLVENQAIVELG